ncbi:MAG: hypothetical protein CL685_00370 [Candidatus Magasanikbacteria bacterium]|nr:hypothetical protein [Candidatus Magasanikbacteria bacterium]|tara:strand:+ start:367 stop:1128 length:762 start_codon:yes stop_codon:yes gene_type:complete
MYVYLYDEFLKRKKYESTIKEIETRLTDFGIAGKILRLQKSINAHSTIEEEIAKGAKTIIMVGNDNTFGHVLSRGAVGKALFGFLPIGPENTIADVLGIPVGVEACEILSRRRKIPLDIGWVNNRYFVSQLHIPPHDISVSYDDMFSVSARYKKMELVVCNLQPFFWKNSKAGDYTVHPQDGKLEAFLRPMKKKHVFKEVYEEPSIFPFEEMVVTGKTPFVMVTDGKRSKEKKITIRLAKKRLEMIVGRKRRF